MSHKKLDYGIAFLSIALMATPAVAADRKPTALLINGFMQYQPDILTPLAQLGWKLEQQGWRVVIDTHLGIQSGGEEPVVIIAHSAGGATALEIAKRQVDQAKFHPAVIMLDAAPRWGSVYRCHVKHCVNIKTPGYPDIRGAKNVPVRIGLLGHVRLATSDHVQQMILRETAPLLHD